MSAAARWTSRPSAWVVALLSFSSLAADAGVERAYVQASTLVLRAEPRADARVLGRLEINSPVDRLDARDGFVQVRVGNARRGWLAASFVGPRPLTLSEATSQAQAASTPGEALTWWQRAAALEPGDLEVLKALKAAYLAAGRNDEAASVVALITFRQTPLFPVTSTTAEGAVIELLEVPLERSLPLSVPQKAWAGLGVSVDRPVWLLPSRGAAVPAVVREVRGASWNECGATKGFEAVLTASLPKGERPLAAVFGPPPAAWLQPMTPVTNSGKASAALRALASLRKQHPRGALHEATGPDGVAVGVVEVVVPPANPEVDLEQVEHTMYWLDGADQSPQPLSLTGRVRHLDLRDVLGDAAPELVAHTDCETVIFSRSGQRLTATQLRCCGC